MEFKMKKRGPKKEKWDTSILKELSIGSHMIFKKAKTRADASGIRVNGLKNGMKLKINLGEKGGARVELVSFIEKAE